MRKFLPLLPLLLATTACGQAGDMPSQEARQQTDMSTRYEPGPPSDVARSPAAAPGISPTAAPGVAFNYRYAFRLPANRIAQVQEEHAGACEKLGVERCLITGMLYRLVNDRNIEGRLAFKLDPALARAFGKQGIEAVTRAAGMLVESEITGEDVGSRIAAATRSEGDLTAELTRIEQQLAAPGLKPQERAELQARAGQLRDTLRSLKAGEEGDRAALASTPVAYFYGSGDLAPGFDNGSPILRALDSAWDNVVAGVAVILMILVTLIPWAIVGLLLWLGWSRISKRFRRRRVAATAEPMPTP